MEPDYYSRKILARHPGIDRDMQLLSVNPFVTLQTVGTKYGLSREYVRLIFPFIMGQSYTEAKATKTKSLSDEVKKLGCNLDPRHKVVSYNHNGTCYRGATAELAVFKKCEELGYSVKPFKDSSIDLNINGYLVDVKSRLNSNIYSDSSSIRYYSFKISNKQHANCDFLVCYVDDTNTFYIIPRTEFPKGKVLYIPCFDSVSSYRYKNRRNSDYLNIYIEAWHLLSIPNTVTAP